MKKSTTKGPIPTPPKKAAAKPAYKKSVSPKPVAKAAPKAVGPKPPYESVPKPKVEPPIKSAVSREDMVKLSIGMRDKELYGKMYGPKPKYTPKDSADFVATKKRMTQNINALNNAITKKVYMGGIGGPAKEVISARDQAVAERIKQQKDSLNANPYRATDEARSIRKAFGLGGEKSTKPAPAKSTKMAPSKAKTASKKMMTAKKSKGKSTK